MRRSLLCFTATISRLVNLTPCLLNVGHFPISSDLIASQLLLAIAHCIPFSLQSGSLVCVIPSHLNPFHLMSSQFFHLIASHPISCLLFLSQLFSADRNCSRLVSCRLSVSHRVSSHLSKSPLSQVFVALLNASQLSAAHVSSSYVFSSLL